MKLDGVKLEEAYSELIVIPRGESQIVMTAKAILDYKQFDTLCPEPTPPTIIKKGGEKVANYQDSRYLLSREEYGKRRLAWIIIESLRLGTPTLEWETVDYGNPNTWAGYIEELEKSGFSRGEIVYITEAVFSANALNEQKIDEARMSFLASQEGSEISSSPMVAVAATPSGEPVNG